MKESNDEITVTEVELMDDLESFDPERLRKSDEKVANFFLVLGLMHNDIKDLILFDIQSSERLAPFLEEVPVRECHGLGEFSGRRIHVTKLLLATLHSLFHFLTETKTSSRRRNISSCTTR
jgi:hypothetical protein